MLNYYWIDAVNSIGDPNRPKLLFNILSREILQGKAQLALKNWKNLFGDKKRRQLNKLRSMLFSIMKTNCCISLSWLPNCLQSCPRAIWSFPLYKISLFCLVRFIWLSEALKSFFKKLTNLMGWKCAISIWLARSLF